MDGHQRDRRGLHHFREYYLEHGQGGTHTQQRNLIQLFNFLERERRSATPYKDGLNRYAAVKGRPKTLSGEFIDGLLEVTGGGRARDFETSRDHAVIRILGSEGIRRMELLGMVMHTMPTDVIQNPTFRLVPLKGARAAGEGRLVMLAPSTARALAMYLRAAAPPARRLRLGMARDARTGQAAGHRDPEDAHQASRAGRVRRGNTTPIPAHFQRRLA